MLPNNIPDERVLMNSGVLFTFLLTQAAVEVPTQRALRSFEAEEYSTISLLCPFSQERLVDPVSFKKEVVEGLTGIDGRTTESSTGVDGDGEMLVCSRALLPSSVSSSVSSATSIPSRIVRLLLCHPGAEECVIWAPPADAIFGDDRDADDADALPAYSALCRKICPDGLMTVFSPDGLKRKGCLTIDRVGWEAVYVGQAPCSSGITIFSPLHGDMQLSESDAVNIATKFAGTALVSAARVDLRTPTEAIMICLDVSSSMSSDVDFRDDRHKVGLTSIHPLYIPSPPPPPPPTHTHTHKLHTDTRSTSSHHVLIPSINPDTL